MSFDHSCGRKRRQIKNNSLFKCKLLIHLHLMGKIQDGSLARLDPAFNESFDFLIFKVLPIPLISPFKSNWPFVLKTHQVEIILCI